MNLKLKFLGVLCILSMVLTCQAKQLTQEEQTYYENLKNCKPLSNEVFTIYGFVNNKCKVEMKMPTPPNSNMPQFVFTYEYPRTILSQMVNDATNLTTAEFDKIWKPREEEFCTLIKSGGKVIYSK